MKSETYERKPFIRRYFLFNCRSASFRFFSHEGELVVDPFVGSGTTLIAARDLNRNAIGFDLNQKYIDLCVERLLNEPEKADVSNPVV